MKSYHIFFIILRLLVILQLALVIFKKRLIKPDFKVIIDSVHKLSIGLFVIIFFYFNNVGLDPWDIYVLQFSGITMILDIDYVNLIEVIGKYSPWLENKLGILKDIDRYRRGA
jgi:hypothetical protein